MPGLSEMLTGVKSSIDPLSLLQLKMLRPALRNGLDPTFGYGAMQSLLAPYTQTPAQTSDALSMLLPVAQSNPNPAAATALTGALGDAGYSPTALSSLTSSLYPSPGTSSPLYQPPTYNPSSASSTIGADDFDAIKQDISSMLQQGASLTDTRKLVMSQARAKGALDVDQLAALYTFIGVTWVQLGGDPGDSPISAEQPQAAPTGGGY